MTLFIVNSLTLCQPPRIRIASAPQSSRYCAALIKFVHSHIVWILHP